MPFKHVCSRSRNGARFTRPETRVPDNLLEGRGSSALRRGLRGSQENLWGVEGWSWGACGSAAKSRDLCLCSGKLCGPGSWSSVSACMAVRDCCVGCSVVMVLVLVRGGAWMCVVESGVVMECGSVAVSNPYWRQSQVFAVFGSVPQVSMKTCTLSYYLIGSFKNRSLQLETLFPSVQMERTSLFFGLS